MVTHATTANNGLSGVLVTGLYAVDNTIASVAALNNALRLQNDSSWTTVGNAVTNTLDVVNSANNRFTGSIKATACTVTGGVKPGLDPACMPTSPSDATVQTGVSISGTIVGPVALDSVNTSAPEGVVPYPGVADWWRFENPFRTFGREGGATTFPEDMTRGRCDANNPCRIWDWRVSVQDYAGVLQSMPLPVLSHRWMIGDAASCLQVVGSYWNGSECRIDFRGSNLEPASAGSNGNGLCDLGEYCDPAMNIGLYQGPPA